MSDALRREGNGVSSGSNGVSGNGNGVSLDEDTMTFGKHESSAEAKRRASTTRLRAPPSPLSVLSNALKIADKVTVTMKRSATRFA
jgi:hypothetical protein